MTPNHFLPAVRKTVLSATIALFAGAAIAPSFVADSR